MGGVRVALAVAMLAACGPVVAGGDSTTTSTTGTDGGPTTTAPGTTIGTTIGSSTTPGTTMPGDGGSTTFVDTTSPGSSSSSADDSCAFLCAPDGGPGTPECDVWAQDCPEGQKCNAWAFDGGSAWNSAKCVPIDPNPAQIGEACTTVDSPTSGIDNCDFDAFCLASPNTNEGVCVAFCIGSIDAPTCANADEVCTITNDGVLIPCLERCNPLSPACPDTYACLEVAGSFACAPTFGEGLAYGESCAELNGCSPGLFCADAVNVPGCADDFCCTEYCDLAVEQPDAACDGQADGQVCAPWYPPGTAPVGFENLGYCTSA